MSGHSKWNNIKRKKEKTDGQKAKLFTKVGREIGVAVRMGGADPASNGKLTRPLVFYLILGLFQTLVERMWYLMSIQASGPSITDPKLQEVLGDMARA
mgnify:CR=1 FL=1